MKALLVNIFGGIMRCDVIARHCGCGENIDMKIPLVVRLEGTNVEIGKKILQTAASPLSLPTTWTKLPRKRLRQLNNPHYLLRQ